MVKKSNLLVKVKAAGLNRADTLQRRGKYPAPKGESDIMGLEMYANFELVIICHLFSEEGHL